MRQRSLIFMRVDKVELDNVAGTAKPLAILRNENDDRLRGAARYAR
ncbi:hypothetical protein [Bradyrhizobium sp. Ec3.3]|nr:hypothetical protein [Bradyrhizobium sp. Ec3.3]